MLHAITFVVGMLCGIFLTYAMGALILVMSWGGRIAREHEAQKARIARDRVDLGVRP